MGTASWQSDSVPPPVQAGQEARVSTVAPLSNISLAVLGVGRGESDGLNKGVRIGFPLYVVTGWVSASSVRLSYFFEEGSGEKIWFPSLGQRIEYIVPWNICVSKFAPSLQIYPPNHACLHISVCKFCLVDNSDVELCTLFSSVLEQMVLPALRFMHISSRINSTQSEA